MSDCFQVSSFGTTFQEKENTQKRGLSEDQKKLIEENYSEILAKLGMRLRISQYSVSFAPSEAASYIVEAAIVYMPELDKRGSFVNFAVDRCFKRMIDEYRKMNRHIRYQSFNRNIIEQVQNENVDQDGFVDEEKVIEKLGELGISRETMVKARRISKVSGYAEKDVKHGVNNFFDDVDMSDYISGIERKAEEFFKEIPLPSMEKRNRISRIRKTLLKDYIIPIIQNKPRKNLKQIALEVDMTEGRLSQMYKDETMKNFFRLFYREVDANGKPIIKRN